MKRKTTTIIFIFCLFAIGLFVQKKYSLKTAESNSFIIINWRMTPALITDIKKPVTFTFHLKDKHNQPIIDAKVSVIAKMFASTTETNGDAIHDQNGFYKTHLVLPAEGEGRLSLTVEKQDGEVIKKELPFTASSAPAPK